MNIIHSFFHICLRAAAKSGMDTQFPQAVPTQMHL